MAARCPDPAVRLALGKGAAGPVVRILGEAERVRLFKEGLRGQVQRLRDGLERLSADSGCSHRWVSVAAPGRSLQHVRCIIACCRQWFFYFLG